MVAYGRFRQLIVPIEAGHVSIALEATADVEYVADAVMRFLEHHELRT